MLATVTPPIVPDSFAFPFQEADRCVLCGLCLPHCPTYRLAGDENESPRGRIVLMRAMATGQLPDSATAARHLSQCLGCRACERVCPSGVRYGRILDAGRAQLSRHHGLRSHDRVMLEIVSHPHWLRAGSTIVRLLQRTGMLQLLQLLGITRRLGLKRKLSMLPVLSPEPDWHARYPALGRRRGKVALFRGCVARTLESNVLQAAIRLMTRLGFDVVLPSQQNCCGALHREIGDLSGAEALHVQNRTAFADSNADAILTLASGCGATLAMLDLGNTPVMDIHEFLVHQSLPAHCQYAPLSMRVAVQDPCSLRNGLRTEQAVYQLLQQIPELHVTALPENSICCGGAGSYPLREPEFADRLRAPKLEALAELRPDRLVTANIGCALHLAAGIREQKLDIPVLHPVVLLEQQLRCTES